MAASEPDSGLDAFDDLINLEERFYRQGYEQGIKDGASAGKIEGRSLGLEKGFEKFLEAGRLYGKAVVWADRLRLPPAAHGTVPLESPATRASTSLTTDGEASLAVEHATTAEETTPRQRLPPLPRNPRLAKNVESVHALMEPATLSTKNEDEFVNDFDDRLKKAQGKAKIVEKMVGGPPPSKQDASAEDRKEEPLSPPLPRQPGGGW